MANELTEYELDVLRCTNGGDNNLSWGAAMSEDSGYLKGRGYLSLCEGRYTPTEKGLKYLSNSVRPH